MANHIHITPEELYDNYEYKVTVKALKREFPFIKAVRVNEDEINNYGLIFLQIVIDPFLMAETYGYHVSNWVKNELRRGQTHSSIAPSAFFDESYYVVATIEDMIEDLMRNIHNSNAIPDTMKLPRGRQLDYNQFVVDPSISPVPVETPVDDSTTV
jgi:hypothetical protein